MPWLGDPLGYSVLTLDDYASNKRNNLHGKTMDFPLLNEQVRHDWHKTHLTRNRAQNELANPQPGIVEGLSLPSRRTLITCDHVIDITHDEGVN
jgi:hypothetical protein